MFGYKTDAKIPVINDVHRQLESWSLLRISWLGKVASLKMKVLPQFVFLFRVLILPLPSSILNEIQHMFCKFVWEGKKSRTTNGKKAHGKVAFPNIRLY